MRMSRWAKNEVLGRVVEKGKEQIAAPPEKMMLDSAEWEGFIPMERTPSNKQPPNPLESLMEVGRQRFLCLLCQRIVKQRSSLCRREMRNDAPEGKEVIAQERKSSGQCFVADGRGV